MIDIAILLQDLGGGGTEKVRVKLAAEFSRRGYKVEFVLLRREGVWLNSLPADVQIVELGAPSLKRALIPLVTYLRQRRPRTLLAAAWPLTSIAVMARLLANVPVRVVCSEHTNLSMSPVVAGAWMKKLIAKTSMCLTYPLADQLIAVSSGVAQSMSALSYIGVERIKVIYNPSGSIESQVGNSCEKRWRESTTFRIVSVGNLKPAKNYGLLIAAFSKVLATTPAELWIIGDGPQRTELEKLAADLGVETVIHMPGFIADPYTYMREADLFVLSSSWEGFPNVLVEALACGTPVVSTDCRSGPREILEHGRYGRLVPVGDVEVLADAIVASLRQEHDRAALIRRSQEFSIQRAADRYLELLLREARL